MKNEIEKAAFNYINSDVVKAENMQLAFGDFINGAEWMQKKMIEKLRELQSGYEADLDTEPRVYERHIQLCAKISLIERLIQELEK